MSADCCALDARSAGASAHVPIGPASRSATAGSQSADAASSSAFAVAAARTDRRVEPLGGRRAEQLLEHRVEHRERRAERAAGDPGCLDARAERHHHVGEPPELGVRPVRHRDEPPGAAVPLDGAQHLGAPAGRRHRDDREVGRGGRQERRRSRARPRRSRRPRGSVAPRRRRRSDSSPCRARAPARRRASAAARGPAGRRRGRPASAASVAGISSRSARKAAVSTVPPGGRSTRGGDA